MKKIELEVSAALAAKINKLVEKEVLIEKRAERASIEKELAKIQALAIQANGLGNKETLEARLSELEAIVPKRVVSKK